MSKKSLIIGNWKMHFVPSEIESFVATLVSGLSEETLANCNVGIAPQHPLLPILGQAINDSSVALSSQNIHWEISGAHTGEVSAELLKALKVEYAIIGHSERRQFYGETDDSVAKRCKTAVKQGLKAVVCVGESEQEYKDGKSQAIAVSQLEAAISQLETEEVDSLVVAYEPVWAIGTGLAATPEHAEMMHGVIREVLVRKFSDAANSVAILYGGSTKPENIEELMSRKDVDGALVGGSSLKAEVFSQLITKGAAAYTKKNS